MKRVVVVGAGLGGLTSAAVLARAGFDVTVLEAHIYAGGCAGTFYHKAINLMQEPPWRVVFILGGLWSW